MGPLQAYYVSGQTAKSKDLECTILVEKIRVAAAELLQLRIKKGPAALQLLQVSKVPGIGDMELFTPKPEAIQGAQIREWGQVWLNP